MATSIPSAASTVEPGKMYTLNEIPKEDWKSITGEMDTGFQILKVSEVTNIFCKSAFDIKTIQMANPNQTKLWHLPTLNPGVIDSILNFGLDKGKSKQGFFGKGIYLTDNAMKANDYSESKGDPESVRILLLCSVALGKSKSYEIGRFERELDCAPENYDSVQGLIRHAREYVVYNNNQVLITHIIHYRYGTIAELNTAHKLPPNIKSPVVFISPALSDFITKVEKVAHSKDCIIVVKKLIGNLLRAKIEPETFLEEVQQNLKHSFPDGILGRLKYELFRSNISVAHSTPPAIASGTDIAPAPTPAPTPTPATRTVTVTVRQCVSSSFVKMEDFNAASTLLSISKGGISEEPQTPPQQNAKRNISIALPELNHNQSGNGAFPLVKLQRSIGIQK